MTQKQIMAIQSRVGTEPDGFWGPKSVAAAQRHLRALRPRGVMWPTSDQASLKRFYGDPAKGEVAKQLVNIDVQGLGVRYGGSPVKVIRCHEKVSGSLRAVIEAVAGSEWRWVLAEFAGVYNHRPMRGGTHWSLHAYGAAIDLLPGSNGLMTHWPVRATMPFEVMEFFAGEGWLAAGAFWSRDAMHFQMTL